MAKTSKKNKIYFDLDGTLIDLYGEPNWLDRIEKQDVSVFTDAKIMVDVKKFKMAISKLKKLGFKIGVISWTPLSATRNYAQKVNEAKLDTLKKLKIKFDDVYITHYGNEKHNFAKKNDILFDDNENVRKQWEEKIGKAYNEKNIIGQLNKIISKKEKEKTK